MQRETYLTSIVASSFLFIDKQVNPRLQQEDGGSEESIIAQYGGWVEGSESLKVYIRPTRETIDSVSRHMASGGNATAEAELRLHCKERASDLPQGGCEQADLQ